MFNTKRTRHYEITKKKRQKHTHISAAMKSEKSIDINSKQRLICPHYPFVCAWSCICSLSLSLFSYGYQVLRLLSWCMMFDIACLTLHPCVPWPIYTPHRVYHSLCVMLRILAQINVLIRA